MKRSTTRAGLVAVGTLAAGLLASACGDGPTVPEITRLPRALSPSEQAVVHGSNTFAFGLLREVRAAQPDSANTFLSPLSASMALGMTLNGAAGETWTQMRDVLGFQGLAEDDIDQAYRDLIDLLLDLDPRVDMALGNAIWTDRGITLLDDFQQRVATYFDATTGSLDFADPASVDVMNDWVSDVTHGRIPKLLGSVSPGVVLYLINAVYFKGDWRSRFDRGRTAPAPFHRADGRTVTVDMMDGKVGYRLLPFAGPDAVQGVELPYGGGAFGAVVLLPPESMGVDELVASLDPATWDAWMAAFDTAAATEDLDAPGFQIRLPKFELEWGDSLMTPLRALGMTDALDPGLADFSRMTGAGGLFIDHVLQKTYVRVDEEGTEAAAATAVGMGVTSAPASLTFDRPFLFAIRERFSGTILFMGVIGDPSA